MQLRIEASDLPGRTCGPGDDFPGYRNIHVGVQRRDRRDELLDLHPGDAPGGRFIYLSWVTMDDDGACTLFRRAKLMLDAIAPGTIDAARRSGRLIARLRLTDTKGHPVCAHARPPLVDWSAAPSE